MKYFLKCLIVVSFFSYVPKIFALSSIKVDEFELIPFFSENTTTYNVFVPDNIENVSINATLSEEDDYITGIGNIGITDGKNEVVLKLIKKSSEIITYQINIFRNYEENPDYENATLSDLEIEGYDIGFEENTYEYEINVEDDERLLIDYEQESDYSTVRISGNSNFKNGENIVKITVISKDKENSNIYVIKVNKLSSVFEEISTEGIKEDNILGKDTLTKKETNIITISIISICSVLVTFLFYLIFIIKKKKTNN